MKPHVAFWGCSTGSLILVKGFIPSTLPPAILSPIVFQKDDRLCAQQLLIFTLSQSLDGLPDCFHLHFESTTNSDGFVGLCAAENLFLRSRIASPKPVFPMDYEFRWFCRFCGRVASLLSFGKKTASRKLMVKGEFPRFAWGPSTFLHPDPPAAPRLGERLPVFRELLLVAAADGVSRPCVPHLVGRVRHDENDINDGLSQQVGN